MAQFSDSGFSSSSPYEVNGGSNFSFTGSYLELSGTTSSSDYIRYNLQDGSYPSKIEFEYWENQNSNGGFVAGTGQDAFGDPRRNAGAGSSNPAFTVATAGDVFELTDTSGNTKSPASFGGSQSDDPEDYEVWVHVLIDMDWINEEVVITFSEGGESAQFSYPNYSNESFSPGFYDIEWIDIGGFNSPNTFPDSSSPTFRWRNLVIGDNVNIPPVASLQVFNDGQQV